MGSASFAFLSHCSLRMTLSHIPVTAIGKLHISPGTWGCAYTPCFDSVLGANDIPLFLLEECYPGQYLTQRHLSLVDKGTTWHTDSRHWRLGPCTFTESSHDLQEVILIISILIWKIQSTLMPTLNLIKNMKWNDPCKALSWHLALKRRSCYHLPSNNLTYRRFTYPSIYLNFIEDTRHILQVINFIKGLFFFFWSVLVTCPISNFV